MWPQITRIVAGGVTNARLRDVFLILGGNRRDVGEAGCVDVTDNEVKNFTQETHTKSTPAQRKIKIAKLMDKRTRRNFNQKIMCQKHHNRAIKRARHKGSFAL